MSRNIITDVIVLKTQRFGEIHKSLTCLSPDLGIIHAIAHGAVKGKSKLSSSSDIFSFSRLYIYFNPVKKSYKINDIEVINLFEDIRGDLVKFYSASLWAELVLKSYAGGGDYHYVFELLKTALFLVNEKGINTDTVMIQFLLRFLKILGFYSHADECDNCGKVMDEKTPAYYVERVHGFVCQNCAGDNKKMMLSPGARKYLKHTEHMDFEASVKIGLQKDSLNDLKRTYYRIIQDIVEVELNTLKSGGSLI